MNVTTAVIPVAGYGTRMLPITKAIEKCMIPVVNRPIIDYVVQDCITAGVTNIIFVIGQGSTQLQAYYGRNAQLEEHLRAHGKEDTLAMVQPPANVTFRYIEQPRDGAYGTAIPVALALPFLPPDQPVLVMGGDDFIWHSDGTSEVKRLLAGVRTNDDCAMMAAEVPIEEVTKYGVIAKNAQGHFSHIVEKPSVQEAPSNLINLAKYVLHSSVLQRVAEAAAQANKHHGECGIIEPINEWVAGGGVMRVHLVEGTYCDGGTLQGWLRSNEIVAGKATV